MSSIGQLSNQSSVRSARSVQAMIQSPTQIVDHSLHIQFTKAGEDLTTNVGPAVAIGIFQVPYIGCGRDITTTFRERDPRGPREVVGKNIAAFKSPVAITSLRVVCSGPNELSSS